tara:strand:- start:653 stop:760 length:108 start_codon:yes stop_codon:yes gene_type:complete
LLVVAEVDLKEVAVEVLVDIENLQEQLQVVIQFLL